jgi:hypothetical protein
MISLKRSGNIKNLKIKNCNQQFAVLLGYERKKLINYEFKHLIMPQSYSYYQNMCQRLVKSNKIFDHSNAPILKTINATLVTRNGFPKSFQMNLKFTKDNNFDGTLIIKLNISRVDKLAA